MLQTLVNRLDFGMSLPQAIASPRASQRNATGTDVEAAFASAPEAAGLRALVHRLNTPAEIGAETGIEFLGRARLEAVAEPIRRGGGSAMVVRSR